MKYVLQGNFSLRYETPLTANCYFNALKSVVKMITLNLFLLVIKILVSLPLLPILF